MAQLQQYSTQNIKPNIVQHVLSSASTNVGSSLGMSVPLIYRNMPERYSVSEMKHYYDSNECRTQQNPQYYRSKSQLSMMGLGSLKSLNRFISDKQVYDKQQKNYNIINSQPRLIQNTIKVYPKYRLENMDQNYFRKLQIQKELTQKLRINRKNGIREIFNPQQFGKYKSRDKHMNNPKEIKDPL